jgi:murein DD-endopeptidase MepM/ murein hydrolase activator NlpD
MGGSLRGRRVGHGRAVEHARWVGLQSIPEPPRASVGRRIAALPARLDRAVDRRITGLLGLILAGLVATVALAATLAGNAPAPLAAIGSPSPTARPIRAAIATPSPSPSPEPTATPAPTPGATPPGLPTGYRWPLAHGRITTPFAPELGGLFLVDGVPFHDGIDIASFCGDHIVAAHDAVVIATGRHVEEALGWVGDVAGYEAHLTAKQLWGAQAIMIITDDGNGYRSVYVHLNLSLVKVGQHVKAGDFIGYEGSTGEATGCHLHYSIYRAGETRLFITDPNRVRKSDLPAAEIARIDPMTVFPPMSTTRLTWGWGAKPSAYP